ncbi:putative type IX secretion system sortase PorU2 [Spirosoma aerolatum]|uniref:putative type IX secretion system sortase PorU2 n=1 Tax=Spirosoma aerolatum TaxID=1211326 RepID=UPI0009ADDAEF|nr:C25 family cysteine peptidase [Spirosoma aerolatum]
MKLIFAILFLVAYAGQAQFRYGNEWIVPTQSYAKISILEDGIYRITYAELVRAGFTPDTINPKNLQLFHRGRELAIEVIGDEDGRFDQTDFIQFYAEKNKGELDSLVYYHTSRANPYQSLFSDETFYFLTIGSKPGLRLPTFIGKPTSQAPEPYHLEQQVLAFTSQYSFNNSIGLVPPVQQSYFEEGEGWTGNYIGPDSVARFTIQFQNRVVDSNQLPTFTFQLNGRSPNNHQLWYALNDGMPIDTLSIGPFSPKSVLLTLTENAIKNESILLKTKSLNVSANDWYSMTYLNVVYPQHFLMNSQPDKYFHLRPNPANQSVIEIPDLNTNAMVYALTGRYATAKIMHQAGLFIVPNTLTGQTVFISNEIKKSSSITVVNFPILAPKASNYLLITHRSLLESATEYAAYRASDAGGGYTPLIIETRSIYEQFNYGERSPMAIRRFADFMLSGGTNKHLFLLGRGISFPDVLKSSETDDLVPTFGYPGSDALLTMGLAGFPEFVQAIPTGRINVTTNQQVLNYLAKVKEFEQAPPTDWQKRMLHLNGGHDQGEILYLKSLMEQLRPIAESPYMGAQVTSLSKKTFEEVEAVDISQPINEGVGMVAYTGHGSSSTLDFNIGYCSAPGNHINNKGKYPILFFNGCSINNLFYKYNPLSTDWLITPDKGAIAVLAGSFWSYPTSTQTYAITLYRKLFTDTTTLTHTLGQLQQQVNLTLNSYSGDLTLRTDLQQIILQGDPALHIFPLAKPDYAARSLFIQARKPGTLIANNDSITIKLILSNTGKFYARQTVPLQLTKTYTNGNVNSQRLLVDVTSVLDTIIIPIKKELSLSQLAIMVDSDHQIDELVETNNEQSLDLTNWPTIQQTSVFPTSALPDQLNPIISVTVDDRVLKNGDYVSANPIIQVILTDENQLPLDKLRNIQTYLKSCPSCPFVLLTQQSGSAVSPVSLLATYQLTNLAPGAYELLVTGRDAADNSAGNAYGITFNVADMPVPTIWKIYPNPGSDIIQVSFTIVSKSAPKSSQFTVINSLGIPVDNYVTTPFVGENTIYLENFRLLLAGLYQAILRINWGDGREEILQEKFVKQ